MKKSILLLTVIGFLGTSLFAQSYSGCLPYIAQDRNIIPNYEEFNTHNEYVAVRNQPYEVYFRFRVPKDTTVEYAGSNIYALINNITINDVEGISGLGMTYLPLRYNTSGQPTTVLPGAPYSAEANGCIQLRSVGNVTKAEGTYPILIKATANATTTQFGNVNFPINYTDYVVRIQNGLASIEESSLAKDPLIYPNPVTGEANLHILATTEQNLDFVVYDLTGRVLLHKQLQTQLGDNNYSFDMQEFKSGYYTYQLLEKQTPITRGKFLLSH